MPILWGGTWKGPGFCELTCDPTKFDSELGSISGEITPMMHEVKKILEPNFGPVHFVTNLMGIRLTKQLINSAFSGMSTVISGSYGEVVRNPKAFKCARYIANEVIKVAKAAKIEMQPAPGLDLKLAEFHTEEELNANAQMYTTWIARFDGILASMLQDLQKGRKCEILAINGVICGMGDQYGVDTPVCDQVVKIVSEIEAGKRTLGIHNLDSMVIPGKI
jgi:2-dehydropantoate 2-reductase